MAVSVCGLLGQHAVRLVALVLSLEADPVITRHLLMEVKTALGTSVRRRVVNSRHVLVRNIIINLRLDAWVSSLSYWQSANDREFRQKAVCYWCSFALHVFYYNFLCSLSYCLHSFKLRLMKRIVIIVFKLIPAQYGEIFANNISQVLYILSCRQIYPHQRS